jgi:hypothetical protein
MQVISLYLVLHACAATFDVMAVKKNWGNQTGPKFSEIIPGAYCPKRMENYTPSVQRGDTQL